MRSHYHADKTFVDEPVPLLPGYLFFETEQDFLEEKITRSSWLLRLLTDTDGEWELYGVDDRFCQDDPEYRRQYRDIEGLL